MYQLHAQDPEGSKVLLTLVSGPEGASLSPAGLLMWKATAEPTNTHMFQFTATDHCNAETTAYIEVRLDSTVLSVNQMVQFFFLICINNA